MTVQSTSSGPPLAPADAALRALSPSQLAFLERLPKAELHAHLNGSIPLPLLQELAREYTPSLATGENGATTTPTTTTTATPVAAEVLAGVQRLEKGVDLDSVHDFFPLFPAIYALTSTPASLKRVTRGVLSHFLDPQPAPLPTPAHTHTSASQVNGKGRGRDGCGGGGAGVGAGGRGWAAVKYFELRTTPRATPHMSRRVYLETVLDEIEVRAPDAAALSVSLDRRMTLEVAREVLELALQLRREGRRVVGVDLCGDPKVRVLANRFACCFLLLPARRAPPPQKLHSRGGGLGKRCQIDRGVTLNAFFVLFLLLFSLWLLLGLCVPDRRVT